MPMPTRVQKACMPSPASSSASERSPTSVSIGKKNVHWNGRNHASVCTQSGMNVIGTSRPESSSSTMM